MMHRWLVLQMKRKKSIHMEIGVFMICLIVSCTCQSTTTFVAIPLAETVCTLMDTTNSNLTIQFYQNYGPTTENWCFKNESSIELKTGITSSQALRIEVTPFNQSNKTTFRLHFNGWSPTLIYPSEVLGIHYQIVTYCQILGYCFIAVAYINAALDQPAHVMIRVPDNRPISIEFNGTKDENEIDFDLNNLDVAFIKCLKCDLTGTVVRSNQKIAVFAGGVDTLIRTGIETSSYFTQMTPVETWGKHFFLVGSNINKFGDIVRITARFKNTIVNMDGYPTAIIPSKDKWIQRAIYNDDVIYVSANNSILIVQIVADGNGHAAMMNVPPTHQYYNETFDISCHYIESYAFSIEKLFFDNDLYMIGNSGYVLRRLISNTCASRHQINQNCLAFGISNKTTTDVQYFSDSFIKDANKSEPMDLENNIKTQQDCDTFSLHSESFNDAGFTLRQGLRTDPKTADDDCKNSSNKILAVLDTEARFMETIDYLRQELDDSIRNGVVVQIGFSNDLMYNERCTKQSSFSYMHKNTCIEMYTDNCSFTNCRNNPTNVTTYHLCSNWQPVEGCTTNENAEADYLGIDYIISLWPSFTDSEIKCTITATSDNEEPVTSSLYSYTDSTTFVTLYENKSEFSKTFEKNINKNVVLRLTSNAEVTVSASMISNGRRSTTVINSLDNWGREYYVASYHDSNCTSFCAITSAYDKTTVNIYFRSHNITLNVTSSNQNEIVNNQRNIVRILDKYTFLGIESYVTDLTGTFISANKPVLVICGAYSESYFIAKDMISAQSISTGPFTIGGDVLGNNIDKLKIRIMAESMVTHCRLVFKENDKDMPATLNIFLTKNGDFTELNANDFIGVQNFSIFCNRPVLVWNMYDNVDFVNDTYRHQMIDVGMTIHSISRFFEEHACIISNEDDPDCDGLSREDLCVLDGYNFPPEKYFFKAGKFIGDFDLDGNYDEDCAFILPECHRPNISNGQVNSFQSEMKTHVTTVYTDLSCNNHFTAEYEVSSITCYSNGSWYPVLKCFKDCLDPVASYPNSKLLNKTTKFSIGTNVAMTCQTGFSLVGNGTIACNNNSIWEPDKFECIADCPDPAIYYKNSTSPNASTDWSSGQTVAMTCQEGYTLVGNATITCMKNSAWELKKFRCISDCPDPAKYYKYSTSTNTTTNWSLGQTLFMTCQAGYTLVGNATITCMNNSDWELNKFICVADCSDPTEIYDNSVIFVNGTWEVNTTVIMSCKDGLILEGESKIKCYEGAGWTQGAFVCKEGCGYPNATIKHSSLRYPNNSKTHGSEHQYICNEGFSVDGNAYIKCLTDSTWSPPKFSCVEGCNDPRLTTNHSVIDKYKNGTPFTRGKTITLKCKPGYTIIGEGRMTCLHNKTWSRSVTCVKDCPDPRLVFQFDNAYLKTFEKTSSRAFGTSYYFRCSLFYTMYGDAQITCLKNSTWSTPAFECKTCKCPCRKRGKPKYDNVTKDVENQIKEKIKNEMKVDKSTVSAATRKKKSTDDKRATAIQIGSVGILILCIVFGGIIWFDISTIAAWRQVCRRKTRSKMK